VANSWQSALEHLGRHRLVLTVCLVVIAGGLAVLGVEAWLRRGEPSREERLQKLAADLGLRLELDPDAGAFRAAVEPFRDLLPHASSLGPALHREAPDQRLRIYELGFEAELPDRLSIVVFEFPARSQPRWLLVDGEVHGEGPEVERIVTAEARQRAATWPEVLVAGDGPTVLVLARPPAALASLLARPDGARPGAALLAPGFDVELDRAIGLINLLDLGVEKVASVRRLAEPLAVKTPGFDRAMTELREGPAVEPPELKPVRFDTSGFDQARARFRERVDAIVRKLDEAGEPQAPQPEPPDENPPARDPPF
jgi:hypothetical protein